MDSNGRRASSSWGTVLVLLIVPPFALIALGVVALAALASVVVLAGAVLAAPYLLATSFVAVSRAAPVNGSLGTGRQGHCRGRDGHPTVGRRGPRQPTAASGSR